MILDRALGAIGVKGFAIGSLVLAAAVAICFFGWRASAADAKRVKADLAAAQTQIETLKLDLQLKEQAALERQADNSESKTQKEELDDARNQSGDDANTRRLRALCIKLRQQAPARFDATPACSRFAGPSGTGDPG